MDSFSFMAVLETALGVTVALIIAGLLSKAIGKFDGGEYEESKE